MSYTSKSKESLHVSSSQNDSSQAGVTSEICSLSTAISCCLRCPDLLYPHLLPLTLTFLLLLIPSCPQSISLAAISGDPSHLGGQSQLPAALPAEGQAGAPRDGLGQVGGRWRVRQRTLKGEAAPPGHLANAAAAVRVEMVEEDPPALRRLLR